MIIKKITLLIGCLTSVCILSAPRDAAQESSKIITDELLAISKAYPSTQETIYRVLDRVTALFKMVKEERDKTHDLQSKLDKLTTMSPSVVPETPLAVPTDSVIKPEVKSEIKPEEKKSEDKKDDKQPVSASVPSTTSVATPAVVEVKKDEQNKFNQPAPLPPAAPIAPVPVSVPASQNTLPPLPGLPPLPPLSAASTSPSSGGLPALPGLPELPPLPPLPK